jgi:hypothetical protein
MASILYKRKNNILHFGYTSRRNKNVINEISINHDRLTNQPTNKIMKKPRFQLLNLLINIKTQQNDQLINQLTPKQKVSLGHLIEAQTVMKFPTFKEPESSLSSSRKLTTIQPQTLNPKSGLFP